MKFEELTAAQQKFLTEIQDQLPEMVKGIFKLTLNALSEPSKEVQGRLDKLAALEAGGVDNWEWYDLSLEAAGLLDNDDEEEDDDK